MKLAVFDFDSTLMDGETIDLLAKAYAKEEEVSKITKEAMNGELDFYQSLKRRVETLAGMPLPLVEETCNNLPYVPGAKELILALKAKDYKVVVFSGGFDEGVSAGKKVLGYDMHFSNTLHHKNGVLTGEVGGEMMFSYSKGRMLKKVQNLLSIGEEDTIVMGDGANDISMFPYAKKTISFCGKDIVKKFANIIVDKKDLREIIAYI
ncbi:phosphoserine phosphatase SerB [Helicobacter apodemus]|uniref:Phosphoserine phosphatase n=1 Tax=Helicobacter apodemus TaxID=135569 RepID=A0A2U8FC04_9HELI|nr:phosphoserine phosphatase SerB [Helicobacter apodemus]AWI33703.1 phosphoserine phosphatase SerB [Helicobacter apodemus]